MTGRNRETNSPGNPIELRELAVKIGLHARNRHRTAYDFDQLALVLPELHPFVINTGYGQRSIDFANAAAVKALNRALLKQFYGITQWDIPANYLCPPIPGRVDYLHYLADLLAAGNAGVIPRGPGVRVLDIGVGANCIYPLLGQHEYGWSFVGSDTDAIAIDNAEDIVAANPPLNKVISLRRQTAATEIFSGIVKANEFFDLTMCNPPFHLSAAQANAGSARKLTNLKINRDKRSVGNGRPAKVAVHIKSSAADAALNFGGQSNELWCAGGEAAFVDRMIMQSTQVAQSCFWFTTLIAKSAHLPALYRTLKYVGVTDYKTIAMAQGQKQSRFIAWTFLDEGQQKAWRTRHR